MPLLLLGAVIAICVAVYMYFFYHQDRFTREKQEPQSPFDIIYLPADLEAAKKDRQKDNSDQ